MDRSSAITGDTDLSTVATAATDACFFAGCFPPAVEIGDMIPKGVGGPFAVGRAVGGWYDTAGTLQEIQQNVQSLCDSLPADAWDGEDRDLFNKQISNLVAELGDSHNTAEAIAIALEVLTVAFPAWITEAVIVSGILAINAALFYAATASGILDVVGVSEEVYAEGLEVSETCFTVMTASANVLMGILGAVTAALVTATITDASVQDGHGDTAAWGDLGQATVDGLGADFMNVVQAVASKKLDERGKGGTGGHKDPEGITPSVETAYRRGMDQVSNLTNRLGNQALDKGVELGTDIPEVPKDLQKLINYGVGRSGPDDLDDLEDTAKKATGEGS